MIHQGTVACCARDVSHFLIKTEAVHILDITTVGADQFRLCRQNLHDIIEVHGKVIACRAVAHGVEPLTAKGFGLIKSERTLFDLRLQYRQLARGEFDKFLQLFLARIIGVLHRLRQQHERQCNG